VTNTDKVERLRELLGKATQVAWKTHEQHPECIIAPDGPFNWAIARCDDDAGYDALGGDVRDEANAALIVEAINALPALLAVVEALPPLLSETHWLARQAANRGDIWKDEQWVRDSSVGRAYTNARTALATLKGEG
jgi:hypothetical protein